MTIESMGAAQRKMILDHLLNFETFTTIHAREVMGIFHPGGRVHELRKKNWPIKTSWYEGEEMVAGRTPKQAQYYLQTEKLNPEQTIIRENVLADNS